MTSSPTWLAEFADSVVACFSLPESSLDANIPEWGCHVCLVDGQWEITLFLCPPASPWNRYSQAALPMFGVNLQALPEVFDVVHGFHWQTNVGGPNDDLGSHVAVEGLYRQHSIWLRVLAHPPAELVAPGKSFPLHISRERWTW